MRKSVNFKYTSNLEVPPVTFPSFDVLSSRGPPIGAISNAGGQKSEEVGQPALGWPQEVNSEA